MIVNFNIKSKILSFFKRKEKKRLQGIKRYIKGTSNLIKPNIQYVDSISLLAGYKEIFEDNCYYFSNESKEPFIVDCGANIGLATIYFKKEYPLARILCFEPDPEIFTVLKHNIENLGFDNVELRNEAVWIEDTMVQFRKEGGFGGRLPTSADQKQANLIQVKAIKLFNFLDQKIDLLKIDIEGSEIEVLKSIEKKLCQITNIFIEYHSPANEPQRLTEILLVLNRNNFRYFIKEAYVPPKPFDSIELQDGMDLQLNIYGINVSL